MVTKLASFRDSFGKNPPSGAVQSASHVHASTGDILVTAKGLARRLTAGNEGRSAIVLRGLEKFRVISEENQQSYRVALIETLVEQIGEADRLLLAGLVGVAAAVALVFLGHTTWGSPFPRRSWPCRSWPCR